MPEIIAMTNDQMIAKGMGDHSQCAAMANQESVASAGEEILAPAKPQGPATGKMGTGITFSVKPRILPPTAYHYWQWQYVGPLGGVKQGPWVFGGYKQKIVFAAPGVRKVQFREKCPLGVYTSSWSPAATITITK